MGEHSRGEGGTRSEANNINVDDVVEEVSIWDWLCGRVPPVARTIEVTENARREFEGLAPNKIRNQKYRAWSFIFVVLFNQFKYFFNLVFLVISLSQLVPALRVNSLFTNLAPLCMVLTITIIKEAYDDYKRFLRDKDANSQLYTRLVGGRTEEIPSSDIKVGDVIVLEKDQRIPADMVLLRTHEKTGSVFIRTDQLDGEIDWKPRNAVSYTQKLMNDSEMFQIGGSLWAERPHKDIHTFTGTFTHDTISSGRSTEPLNVENTLWMNTVLAGGNALGIVIYTGKDTRAVMNTSQPKSKSGLVDMELNTLTKILGLIVVSLAFILVALKGLHGAWLVYLIRFVVLFSAIIPLSLRVNLDMGKTFYSSDIMNDTKLPGVIVRTSTIPEELGRLGYLLSDKTGTLTKNDMELKKIHLGTMAFGADSRDEIRTLILDALKDQGGPTPDDPTRKRTVAAQRGRRDIASRLFETVQALALCHNVTPVIEEESISYQASSPDEIAIVKWTELVGLTLVFRDRDRMTLRTSEGHDLSFDILHVFPFNSDTKRMGVIVRDNQTGELVFYEKGADMMMARIVQHNDWLDEESSNMAREGLRTLALGRRRLTQEQFAAFDSAYSQARVSISNRATEMQKVVETLLERDLELLALTGVEDKLQDNVKMTLELLRQAEIKIWMLTGDKIETATNIAISTRLFARNQKIHVVPRLASLSEAREQVDLLYGKHDIGLVIDGPSLRLLMSDTIRADFVDLCTALPAVVCCRCTPTQKADIALMLKASTPKRVACIGDGGNDVSMIQAADVGIGIVGKEGRQASLAADFSVIKFSQLTRLILWHGRNSYKRTAKLSLFVIHRGMVIAVLQSVFSAIFYFAPIALYQGWIAVGYTTVYTMWPVFSLVLDRDVSEEVALLYPELYKDLTKGRELGYKEFFKWLSISVYQGGVIMLLAIWLFEREFIHIVSITFTALILNELLMVALEVNTWHYLMGVAEIGSFLMYVISVRVLKESFDVRFTTSFTFFWKVALITVATFVPLYLFKIIKHFVAPPSSAKLQD